MNVHKHHDLYVSAESSKNYWSLYIFTNTLHHFSAHLYVALFFYFILNLRMFWNKSALKMYRVILYRKTFVSILDKRGALTVGNTPRERRFRKGVLETPNSCRAIVFAKVRLHYNDSWRNLIIHPGSRMKLRYALCPSNFKYTSIS